MAQGFRARMNNFHSVLIEVLNTAQFLVGKTTISMGHVQYQTVKLPEGIFHTSYISR